MKRAAIPSTVAAVVLTFVTSASALGPGDSPVPSISASESTRVLFHVPGVIKNNGIETAIMCTSLDTVDATVAFEVFAPEGGDALNDVAVGSGNGTLPLPVGHTVTISTGTSVGLHEDAAITGLGNVKNGAARILGTSTRILCTGILVDKSSATPNTIATLKLFSRRKQNGD